MKCRHVLLLDTSGSFKLAIRLPTKDYRPRLRDRKENDTLYRLRHPERVKQSKRNWQQNNKDHFNRWCRKWRNNMPEEKKRTV
jgi:hypothetical protein